MLFDIDRKSSEPICKQITKKIKNLIKSNMLNAGEKIPSIGELATLLVVNPKNVFDAYRELEQEGIIKVIDGKGYFVCTHVNPVKDEKKILEIKLHLGMLIEEAYTLDLCESEFISWVHAYFAEVMKQGKTKG